MLTIYDPQSVTYKTYVVSNDRRLRQTTDPGSPRLPAFRHENQNRTGHDCLNIFLVILNAEIKFRRYFQELQLNNVTNQLPQDVLGLMNLTVELANLIYWKPVPTEGSKGKEVLSQRLANARRNTPRSARPDPAKTIERLSSEDTEMGDVGGPSTVLGRNTWFADANVEERKAYLTMLTSESGT
jgi:hypothetical protein